MKAVEYIHPNMISEFAHTADFALKMKAFQYLDCRHLGMSPTDSEALYNITEQVANRYEEEWVNTRGHIYELT
jgi:hypothetical protein